MLQTKSFAGLSKRRGFLGVVMDKEAEEERLQHTHELEERSQGQDDDPTSFYDDWMTSRSFKELHGVCRRCGKCGCLARRVFRGEKELFFCSSRNCTWKGVADEAPLAMSRTVKGVTLYAYNEEHALYLIRLIGAKNRFTNRIPGGCPICNMSIMRKLPAPILDGHNRDAMVSALNSMLEEYRADKKKM